MPAKSVDGSADLASQIRAINTYQNSGPYHLTDYQSAPIGADNLATFTDVPLGGDVRPVHAISAGDADSPAQIIATQLAAGKILVCDSQVFVSSKPARALLFR